VHPYLVKSGTHCAAACSRSPCQTFPGGAGGFGGADAGSGTRRTATLFTLLDVLVFTVPAAVGLVVVAGQLWRAELEAEFELESLQVRRGARVAV
jgi:hypothetical protein